jgi:hypothetical protein
MMFDIELRECVSENRPYGILASVIPKGLQLDNFTSCMYNFTR